MIDKLRLDTPGCSGRIHLNNAGAALPPQIVFQTMTEYLALEAEMGGYEAADMQKQSIEGFYTAIANMLGAQPHNIAFAGSATDAYARVLSAIPWKAGDAILTTENDYVSNQISFLALQKRFGVKLLRARDQESGGTDPEHFERLIEQHRPKLVAVTHIPTNSGLVQPVALLGAICRKYDVLYLVDACQSAGQMQLDVNAIQCDFLTATLRKFLRGPRGAGFLYASDRALEQGLELMLPDMRSADWTGADTYNTSATARRFEYWEMSPALMLGSKLAVEYALHLGLDWIEQRVKNLAQYSRQKLETLPGATVLDRGIELSGIVTAHATHWDERKMLPVLQEARINCRISTLQVAQIDFNRKGVTWALRVSPHYYNTESEINRLTEVLQTLHA